MKKIIISILVICSCFILTGCNHKKVGGWELDLKSNRASMEEKELQIFNNTVNGKYEAVALLGKQLVSGMNYMYLCRNDKEYKVIVIYNDLENKATITSEKTFDITKYVFEKNTPEQTDLVGGWKVTPPQRKTTFDKEIRESFETAQKELEDIEYYPAVLLGKQLVSGTNYAILSYGVPDDKYDSASVYVITLYKDLKGNEEIVGYAYVDLTEYAK